ncbi:hypothetical protein T02_15646 [Trichinella nativa]|uniref:Uncharacterized protein n=1 Tax=Trichinella nativa TaxID=6335 RepID=A0A0V1LFG2_9BILA|nr:hypothetical protein T02_15646 [Trichinella nativa]
MTVGDAMSERRRALQMERMGADVWLYFTATKEDYKLLTSPTRPLFPTARVTGRILSAAPLSPGNEIENSQRKFPVYTRTLSPRRLQSAPTIGHRNRPSPGPAWPTLRSASLHQYGTEQRLLVSPRLHGQPRSASSCVPTKSPRSITWSVTPAA